jgi:hypothetical protein
VVPTAAYAQASITGVVKDTSGAVLPGVTVEASSPALIEKARSVLTDGTGQYRIENLRPGTYAVTFTLSGFSTIRREGIELAGSFVASVNTELRVGGVQETLTVTGETPIVDIQSTTRQKVIDHTVIDTVPTGRMPQQLAVLIPGVNNSGSIGFNGMTSQDVGGAGRNENSRSTTARCSGGRSPPRLAAPRPPRNPWLAARHRHDLQPESGRHPGGGHRYRRRLGRGRRRRRANQPHSQGRRQHLPRHPVHQLRERVDGQR